MTNSKVMKQRKTQSSIGDKFEYNELNGLCSFFDCNTKTEYDYLLTLLTYDTILTDKYITLLYNSILVITSYTQNSPPSLVYANYSQPSAAFMQFSRWYSFHCCRFGNSFYDNIYQFTLPKRGLLVNMYKEYLV